MKTIKSQPDPPENCHLTVKKLPKTWLFFFNCQKFSFFSKKLPLAIFLKKRQFLAIKKKKSSFWQFFDSQNTIFWRVRYVCLGWSNCDCSPGFLQLFLPGFPLGFFTLCVCQSSSGLRQHLQLWNIGKNMRLITHTSHDIYT